MLSILTLFLAQTDLATLPATVGDVRSVVAKLAKASGAKLSVSPTFRTEIVGLASPGKPLQQSLDSLAMALDAKWTPRESGLVLERSAQLESERQRRDRESKLRILREGIAKATADSPDSLTLEAAKKAYEQSKAAAGPGKPTLVSLLRARADTPAGRLSRRLISLVRLEDLIELKPGKRTVFSTNPTPMQLRLQGDFRPALDAFNADQRSWFEALRNFGETEENARTLGGQPTPERVGKILIVTRSTQSYLAGQLEIEARIYNDSETLIAQNSLAIEGVFGGLPSNEVLDTSTDEEPIALNEFSTRLARHLKLRANPASGTPRPPLFPSDLADLAKPTVRDPLAWVATSPLQTIADREKKVVAAVLPDSLMSPLLRGRLDARVLPARWLADLEAQRIEVISEPDRLVMRPQMPIYTESVRSGRVEMEKFFSSIDKDEWVRLDPVAEYIASGKAGFGQAYLASLSAYIPMGALAQPPNLLRLYWSLTVNQRSRLKAGTPILFRELSREQATIAADWFFDTDAQHYLFPILEEGDVRSSGIYGPFGNLYGEPTEAFPHGLKPEARLSVEFKERPGLFSIVENGRTLAGRVDLGTIASERFVKSRPDLYPPTEKGINPISSKVREGTSRDWSFNFELIPNITFRYHLKDDSLGDRSFDKDAMPKDQEAIIEQLLKDYRERYKNTRPDSGGKVPPP